MTTAPLHIEPADLEHAARVVAAGGVIAYPTEFCFGLGCDPMQPNAVRRILALKGRSREMGLILIAAGVCQLRGYVDAEVLKPGNPLLAEARVTWPGPVTWILPAHPRVSGWVRGSRTTVGVRVTRHRGAAELCLACGIPLVSTSANYHGQAPARSARQVELAFGDGVDFVVPGRVGAARGPSTVKVAGSGDVIRATASSSA